MCEIRLLFPVHMRTFFQDDTWQSGLEEIRVRVGQPIEFCYGSDNCYLIGKEKEQMFCSERTTEDGKKICTMRARLICGKC